MQGSVAFRLEALRVETDKFVLFRRQAQRLGGDVLERQQQFAMVVQEGGRVRTIEFD